MIRQLGISLASKLVRSVFSVYLAFAIALTLLQTGIEYYNTYSVVLDEIDSTVVAFEPGISNALWDYQRTMLQSIATGMVNGGAVTGVDIGDASMRFRVTSVRAGEKLDAQKISKRIELFRARGTGPRELIGFMTVYSSHQIVFERVKFGVMLILIDSVLKTAALWLIIVFFVNRLLAGPLRRFTKQIESLNLSIKTRPPRIDLGPAPSGELVYLQDTFNALMERAAANKQLVMEKEAAEAANLEKSRFLAAASHDLRQPLHALILFSNLLNDASAEDKTIFITHIRTAVDSLNALFGGLLDLSRLDAGAMVPMLAATRLSPLIEAICTELGPKAEAKNLVFRTELQDVTVTTDPLLIERVLRNLIENAIKYTDCGSVIVRIVTFDAIAVVEIEDTGIGIDMDQQAKVFDEFYQLRNPERDIEKGVGLGLAIVQRLCDLLGHRIGLCSQPGRGSIFTVSLSQAYAEDASQSLQSSVSPIEDLKDLSVVVIDDNLRVNVAMGYLLTSWGCRPQIFRSLEEANESICDFDAAIVDLRLREGKSGFDVIMYLRERFGMFPAAVITGDFQPFVQPPAALLDVSVFQKPVQPHQFAEWLSQVQKNRTSDRTQEVG